MSASVFEKSDRGKQKTAGLFSFGGSFEGLFVGVRALASHPPGIENQK
ncbi:hypothetical protein ACFO3A_11355 [Comamonas nitrativorans]|uniref:Uncharacterized protein n=1 Tax=Comamonas nitrativorans TaxID=108437 RepID=A0ABV9GZ26_9BURK